MNFSSLPRLRRLVAAAAAALRAPGLSEARRLVEVWCAVLRVADGVLAEGAGVGSAVGALRAGVGALAGVLTQVLDQVCAVAARVGAVGAGVRLTPPAGLQRGAAVGAGANAARQDTRVQTKQTDLAHRLQRDIRLS